MAAIGVSGQELKDIMLSEIRSRRGGETVKDIVILRDNFPKARCNWSLKITDYGEADKAAAQLIALLVQRDLQPRYRLFA